MGHIPHNIRPRFFIVTVNTQNGPAYLRADHCAHNRPVLVTDALSASTYRTKKQARKARDKHVTDEIIYRCCYDVSPKETTTKIEGVY